VFLDALEDTKQDAPHIGINYEIRNTTLSTFQPQFYYKIKKWFTVCSIPFLQIHLLA
jgi:hypothetical protein